MPVLLVADGFGAVLLELIALKDFITRKEFLESALAKENHLSVFSIPAVTVTKELPREDAIFFERGLDVIPDKREYLWSKKGENKLSTDNVKGALWKRVLF